MQGHSYQQQDADECYQNINNLLEVSTKYDNEEKEETNVVNDLFRVEFQVSMQNQELPDEPVSLSKETNRKLLCNIDNEGNPINHLPDGIQAVEKINLSGDLASLRTECLLKRDPSDSSNLS